MSFQILPDIQSLVRACLHSLKYNVLFLHLGQITFLHFCLVHQSLLELSFINIVSSSGLHQNIWSLLSTSSHNWSVGSVLQRQVQFLQVISTYVFYNATGDMIDNDYNDNNQAHWLNCVTFVYTHQERPGSTNDLIWFGWVHLQNHHRVEWMVTPTFTKISSNLIVQNIFSFYLSCGNHSCLHFTANSMWNKTNVYIPRMYLSVVILSKEQTNIFNLDSFWIDVVLIGMTWYGEDNI